MIILLQIDIKAVIYWGTTFIGSMLMQVGCRQDSTLLIVKEYQIANNKLNQAAPKILLNEPTD